MNWVNISFIGFMKVKVKSLSPVQLLAPLWTVARQAPLSMGFSKQDTPVLLPGKSYGQRSLVGCSPWGRWGWDTTERLSFHFSLSCMGEGNGNPLQCSCLENPRDGGAWWAAICGVTQSRTWLKWLSSSSSLIETFIFIIFFQFLWNKIAIVFSI